MSNNQGLNNNQSAQKVMPKPSNEIDMQAITTFPHISSEYMSLELVNKFRNFEYVTDEKGVIIKDVNGFAQVKVTEDFWGTMKMFTQDFRLGNLSKEEANYIRFKIDLASDILTVMPPIFSMNAFIELERAVNVNETSQSKGGFLRRMFNTFFSNSSVKSEENPTKRSFFGLGKKSKE